MDELSAACQRLLRNDHRTPETILTTLDAAVAVLTTDVGGFTVRDARRYAASAAADALAVVYLTGGSPDDITDAIDHIYPPHRDHRSGVDSLLDRADRADPDDWWINGQQYATRPPIVLTRAAQHAADRGDRLHAHDVPDHHADNTFRTRAGLDTHPD